MSTLRFPALHVLLFAAALPACAGGADAPASVMAAPEVAAVPELAPAAPAGPSIEVRPVAKAGEAPATPGAEVISPSLERSPPAELRVALQSEPGKGSRLQLSQPGQLLMVRQGNQRGVGVGSVEVPIDTATVVPIVWESTHPETLDTLRGVALVHAGSARLLLAEPPRQEAREDRHRHACRAFHDGEGGFSVVCRVSAMASAASLGGDPNEGVFTQVGDPTLVRLDLQLPADGGVDAGALGYLAAGSGVVVRAEASRLPGEASPSLALLSAERVQPIPMPRFHHHHHRRPPHIDLDVLF